MAKIYDLITLLNRVFDYTYKHLNVTELHKTPSYIVPTFDVTVWSGFTNQPDDDGVEIVSSSASDTGSITIWGTDHDTGTLTYETVTLTGTDAVSTVKTDWGNVLGVFMGDADGQNAVAAVGTITVREASGNQTITTIATTKYSIGLVGFAISDKNVTIINVSGNMWYKHNAAVTSANGYPFGSAEKFDARSTSTFTLISDGSSATAKLLIYAD